MTLEKVPHARPRYSAPDPVTLQFTNENPVSSNRLIRFCAVRAPYATCEPTNPEEQRRLFPGATRHLLVPTTGPCPPAAT
ncbi:hypothetical protein BHE74_00029745 [Ensete ventricosum]|nr:hypothetical protein BHE74_00029745 [Ensete ventricosum]